MTAEITQNNTYQPPPSPFHLVLSLPNYPFPFFAFIFLPVFNYSSSYRLFSNQLLPCSQQRTCFYFSRPQSSCFHLVAVLCLPSSCHYPFLFSTLPKLNVVSSPPSPLLLLSPFLLYRPDLHNFLFRTSKARFVSLKYKPMFRKPCRQIDICKVSYIYSASSLELRQINAKWEYFLFVFHIRHR